MITIRSMYWNMALGHAPGDVDSDREGVEMAKQVEQNMIFADEGEGREGGK